MLSVLFQEHSSNMSRLFSYERQKEPPDSSFYLIGTFTPIKHTFKQNEDLSMT
jgi:hypothetical protein